MPRRRTLPRLEELSLQQFVDVCANACTRLEEAPPTHLDLGGRKRAEARFVSLLKMLPTSLLESVVPSVVKNIAGAVRKNRSHKGLLKALECLPQSCLRRLDIGALFSEVRLYGEVNVQCKILLRSCLQRLPALTHLNLESKCNDEMLLELSRHCPNLEDLNIPTSDVTDRGLIALCGIYISATAGGGGGPTGDHQEPRGCLNLTKLGVHNCINITMTGIGSVLRNLPKLVNLAYDKLADAVETVSKIDGDYLAGRKVFRITHLDQFSDFYEFEAHPDLLPILLKVCPSLESLRFYVSDEGSKVLSQIPNIRHLQLETDDVGNGFRLLTRKYSNLVSLHLTFRAMPFSQLMDVADNCPLLQVLRLIGFDITDSHNLVPHPRVFVNLRSVDLRMVRQVDQFDDFVEDDAAAQMDAAATDTVTPQLMHYVLDHCLKLEELTVEAVASWLDETFLLESLRRTRCNLFPGFVSRSAVPRGRIGRGIRVDRGDRQTSDRLSAVPPGPRDLQVEHFRTGVQEPDAGSEAWES